MTGEQKLAAAVLERAWMDLTGPLNGERGYDYRSAYRFLSARSPLLSLWCDLLGLNTENVNAAASRRRSKRHMAA